MSPRNHMNFRNSRFPHNASSRVFASALACAALALSGTLSSGCTLDDGQPWGRLGLSASAVFDPAARLDDEGRIRTIDDYRVNVELLQVDPGTIDVEYLPPGEALSFEPAAPPEGYSLCHNGHCHADDGRLVDYEDIAAELNGGASGGGAVTYVCEDGFVLIDVDGAPLTLIPPESENLERGTLTGVRLTLEGVVLHVTVFDSRTGENARLPEEGVHFEDVIALNTALFTNQEITVDRGEDVNITIDATAEFPAELFDNIAWDELGALPSDERTFALSEALSANLDEYANLELSISRSGE